ncbi:MAG: AraC family transcriptional regulator [Victivallales bacterium]|nr:AraC family transcriptional regulator [Victivallales bacterium]
MSYYNDISFITVSRHVSSCYTSVVLKPTCYSLEYIGGGSTFLANNGKSLRLTAPAVFWMLPGNTYQFFPDNKQPVEHLWVDFYGPRMLDCLSERIPKGMIALSRPSEFEMIFEEMINIYREFPISKSYLVTVCLERLMGIVYSASLESNTKKTRYDFIVTITDRIKNLPLNKYDFRKIARENSISYDHFRILFRAYNDISPHEYLLQCRMEYAARILQREDIMIKNLATQCGFNETSSFSRMFKNKIGVSPTKYLSLYKRK